MGERGHAIMNEIKGIPNILPRPKDSQLLFCQLLFLFLLFIAVVLLVL